MPKESEIKNLAASVKARLFNYAKDNGKDFQGVFRLYVQERFLYRLSKLAYAILEKIRYHFKKLPVNYKRSLDFPVNDPRYFEELSSLLIPSCKKNDPRFMMAAKAIVLFFFKSCEFGRKTPYDPPTLFTKYSNVNDYSSF